MTEVVRSLSGELIDYRPVSSVEIEFIIRELGDRLEQAVPVLDHLQRARYAAISAHSVAFEMAKVAAPGTYNEKRSAAILATQETALAVDNAKAELHHAENLQDALKAKLMGYQNINKVNGAAYGAGGTGR